MSFEGICCARVYTNPPVYVGLGTKYVIVGGNEGVHEIHGEPLRDIRWDQDLSVT